MSESVLALVQKSDHSLGFYRLADGAELARVPLERHPHECALSPDGKTLCVSEYGVRNSGSPDAGGNSVAVVDVAAREVAARISCEGMLRPHGIAFDAAGALYVLSESSDRLLVKRDPRAGGGFDIVRETGGRKGHMLAVRRDGSRAFFMNIESRNVTTLDLTGRKSAPTVVCEGENPEGVCFNADESLLFAANRGGADISVIDAQTLRTTGVIRTRKSPLRMAMDGRGRIVCVHFADDFAASIVNPETGGEETSFVPPAPAVFVGFDAAKRRMILSLQNDTALIFNADSLRCDRVVAARAEPDAAAFIRA